MRTARLESPSWPRDRLLLAWAHQTQGHWVRELASSPLAQVAPLGGVGADTRLMGRTRQTGAYQTACDHNQQWQRTMNAIIYKNTVQVSFSLSLFCLFTLALFLEGSMRGCDLVGTVVSSAQGYPAIHCSIAIRLGQCPAAPSFLPSAHFEERSRKTYETEMS